jgi:hypothetical protein
MEPRLTRYQCPECGSGLSRTLLYPRSDIYELQFPPYQVPVAPICAGIVVVGFGLAFVHVALSLLGVLVIAAWVWWRYYGALQCDGCGAYYISGQFAGVKGRSIAWQASDTKTLARRVAVPLLIGLAVFLPIYLIEQQFNKRCAAECAAQGLAANGAFRSLRCTCAQPAK